MICFYVHISRHAVVRVCEVKERFFIHILADDVGNCRIVVQSVHCTLPFASLKTLDTKCVANLVKLDS